MNPIITTSLATFVVILLMCVFQLWLLHIGSEPGANVESYSFFSRTYRIVTISAFAGALAFFVSLLSNRQ